VQLIAPILAVAVALVAACAPGTPGLAPRGIGEGSESAGGGGIDVERAHGHAAALVSLGPRPQGQPAASAAADHIERELRGLGLSVERMTVGRVELPDITVLGVRHRARRTVEVTDPNLVVRLGPPGPALLVMAHYDSVAASPGAIDNAAAVGVLLELARVLRDEPPRRPVLLVFTAAEEIGLAGAESLAERRGAEVAFAISLDLIGGTGRLTLNGASTLIGLAELRWFARAADLAGVALSAPLPHRVISRWWPQAERSDHGAFTRRGIPAVHFYHRGNDGEWIDRAYHGPRDELARIDRRALGEIGRLLRALIATEQPAGAGDGLWLPFATNTVVPRSPLVALAVGLVVIALGALVWSRDGLVAWMSRREERRTTEPSTTPPRRAAGLLAGAACYTSAVIAAAAIERLTAGGHPAPWLHAPLTALVGHALLLAGLFGLATRGLGRVLPWSGGARYLAAGAALPLAIGVFLLAAGAAELAWVWLVPAAVIAIAPRLGKIAPLAFGFALVPAIVVLQPNQLREAAWNGFLPPGIPLAVWVGGLAAPAACTMAWWLRTRGPAGPLRTFVLALGCALAGILGMIVLGATEPACSPAEFGTNHLACERV
jgi:hypothetical protein